MRDAPAADRRADPVAFASALGIPDAPTFAFVAAWPALVACLPGLDAVVHVAQDMRFGFERVVEPRARVVAVRGSVVAVEAEADTCRFIATCMLRPALEAFGALPSVTVPSRTGDPFSVVERSLPHDLAVRYADASGDRNPVHLDDDVARAAGFPRAILHGMCTLALALHDTGVRAPRRVAARFAAPVIPGTTIRTTTWRTSDRSVRAFETEGPDGVALRRAAVWV